MLEKLTNSKTGDGEKDKDKKDKKGKKGKKNASDESGNSDAGSGSDY